MADATVGKPEALSGSQAEQSSLADNIIRSDQKCPVWSASGILDIFPWWTYIFASWIFLRSHTAVLRCRWACFHPLPDRCRSTPHPFSRRRPEDDFPPV